MIMAIESELQKFSIRFFKEINTHDLFSIPLLPPVLYGIGFRSVLPPVTQT
jgi:hypothetical protein